MRACASRKLVLMDTSSRTRDVERLAKRRRERVVDLGPSPLRQLEAGFPVLYRIAGDYIEEHPDGRRYVVQLTDGGRSTVYLREV